MTDRDHFAAAALTGLLATGQGPYHPLDYFAKAAYEAADAMLRERCREKAGCPVPDNAPNHDAAPAARARTDADRGRTDKADSRPGEGTGDTPVTEPMPKEKRAEVSDTLTDAEREAIERSAAAWEADARMGLSDGGVAATLRGLLDRLGGVG